MIGNDHILNKVLMLAESSIAKGQVFQAIFDLDSTLYDVSPRALQIFRHFTEDSAMRSNYPEACLILEQIRAVASTYKFKNQLLHLGLNSQAPHFYPTIYEYWRHRFFSNDYLQYDVPYEGAVEYVNDLYKLGAEIIYLTGRDVTRMGKGTEESLTSRGFPLDDRAALVLKPDKEMDDAEFKRDYLMGLAREKNEVWFFENEPANIDLVLKEVNHVNVVYFDSVHAEKAEPPGNHIPRITSFKRKGMEK